MRGFIQFLSYPVLFLIITLGWQQSIMAQTSGGVPGFTILSNSSPGFSVTTASRFAWLLEDIEIPINRSEPVLEFDGQTYNPEVKKCLRIYPQDNDTEGFFVSKFKKLKEIENE